MDQKRLMLAIAVSIAILLGFQFLVSPHLPHPPAPAPTSVASNQAAPGKSAATPAEGSPGVGGQTVQPTVPKNVPSPRTIILLPGAEGVDPVQRTTVTSAAGVPLSSSSVSLRRKGDMPQEVP